MVIAFDYLGRLGRLGNQMFQYAALRGIAHNRGFDFCIPNHNLIFKEPLGFDSKIDLFSLFKMASASPSNISPLDFARPVVRERHFHFDQLLFDAIPDEHCLVGFFQSEKYFMHIQREIRIDYLFRDEIIDSCRHILAALGDSISLHVRRGDYLVNPNHAVLDLKYYEDALDRVPSALPVVVFSDDPEFCGSLQLFSGNRFIISRNRDPYTDFCLMSLCKHHIIANSSFSWWGAWLSGSDNVIAPLKWFGEGLSHCDTRDLIPKRWTRI